MAKSKHPRPEAVEDILFDIIDEDIIPDLVEDAVGGDTPVDGKSAGRGSKSESSSAGSSKSGGKGKTSEDVSDDEGSDDISDSAGAVASSSDTSDDDADDREDGGSGTTETGATTDTADATPTTGSTDAFGPATAGGDGSEEEADADDEDDSDDGSIEDSEVAEFGPVEADGRPADFPRPSDFQVDAEAKFVGSKEDEIVDGSDSSDDIRTKKGDDHVSAGGGDDIVQGGHGDDTLDGGEGMDSVDGGKGDDTLIYTLGENAGNADFYDGGKGSDTLVLRLTSEELSEYQEEIDALEEWMSETANVKRSSSHVFNDASVNSHQHPVFETSFGLHVRNIEDLEIEIIDGDPAPDPDPEPDPDPVPDPEPDPEPTVIRVDANSGSEEPVSVALKPGEQIKLEVGVNVAALPPMFDVMMLQDLTGSFWDDLPLVQELFPALIESLTDGHDAAIGLGSFKDKPVDDLGWEDDYVYQTEHAVSTDLESLQATIDGYEAWGGRDWPEAQLEALAQAAIREDEIGYRDGTQKFAMVFSDAPPHLEGDNLSAVVANNLDAELDPFEDYPAIDALGELLKSSGITPIFAVTANVMADYQAIVDEWGFGVVTELASDSSNLVEAVVTGLEEATVDLALDISGDEFGYVSGVTPEVYENAGPGDYVFEVTLEIPADAESYSSDDFSIAIPGYGEIALEIDIDRVDVIGDDGANDMAGGAEPNDMFGFGGDDLLDGRGGNDVINGGTGDDVMSGGLGDDTFVFADGDGHDVITDFQTGAGSEDVLDLTNLTTLRNIIEVQDAASQVGDDTVIQIDADQSITLENVDADTLHEDDFLF